MNTEAGAAPECYPLGIIQEAIASRIPREFSGWREWPGTRVLAQAVIEALKAREAAHAARAQSPVADGQDTTDYEALEREHLGNPDKRTGIYVQAEPLPTHLDSPDAWVRVPRYPTTAQLDAICTAGSSAAGIYKATLTASPAAPTTDSVEDAYVIKRLSTVLAEVAAAIMGDAADGSAADVLAKLPEAAQTLKIEVELYRANAAAPAQSVPLTREQFDAMRVALEVIAVGDSKTPSDTAAHGLVASGFWTEMLEAANSAVAVAPAQSGEAVAWMYSSSRGVDLGRVRWSDDMKSLGPTDMIETPLYAAPQPSQPSAAPLDDELLESAVESSDGRWHEDEFRINGKDLMNLCRAIALLARAASPQAEPEGTYPPCQGLNCGCTDGANHSPECFAEHASTIAGGQFIKGFAAQPVEQATATQPAQPIVAQALTPAQWADVYYFARAVEIGEFVGRAQAVFDAAPAGPAQQATPKALPVKADRDISTLQVATHAKPADAAPTDRELGLWQQFGGSFSSLRELFDPATLSAMRADPAYGWDKIQREDAARIAALTESSGKAQRDSARLDTIAAEYLDVVSFAIPYEDDADVGWRVIQHHMAEPHERVIAEVHEDNLRAALDGAIAALQPTDALEA